MGQLKNLATWLKEKTFLRKLVLRNTNLFKRIIWDYEYSRGSWDHIDGPPNEAFARFIQDHLKSGAILDLGCGTGKTIEALSAFSRYTGVDVSRVATEQGREAFRNRDNVVFTAADIATYQDDQRYDLILWTEVIYYFGQEEIIPILKRYQDFLAEGGVQMVQVYSMQEKAAEVQLIRENFTVIAEHETPYPDGNTSIAMVF